MTKRINLHPQHAPVINEVTKRMTVSMGLAAGLGVLVSVLFFAALEIQTIGQESRATYMKGEIEGLDLQIKQIADVLEQTDILVARKKVVEKLQFNRGQAVLLLNEMSKLAPEGVQLRSIEQQQEVLKVTGWALSNENVSQFLKALESSPRFEPPKLIEVKAIDSTQKSNSPTSRVQEFQLTVKMPIEKTPTEQSAGHKTKKSN